jgi:parallel beta-helix repeat protein
VTFVGNDVTNGHTAICFVLGGTRYGRADRVVIRGNRIHHCGRLPATNHDHGIYLAHSSRAVISGNEIFDNADRGVQLYPNAQRARIVGNVIDGNGQGVIFSGANDRASSNNLVAGNVIANSRLRYNVESYWPRGNPVGTGNVVRGNCLSGAARGGPSGVQSPSVGFVARDNVVGAPRYFNRAAGDLRLGPGSPCYAQLGRPSR